MKKGDYLSTILKSSKTVFTLKDIVLLWQEENIDAVRKRLNYYTKNGELYRIRRGIYAKSKNYNAIEAATRIFIPAYVSFETVLAKEGLIFQYQTNITVASYLTRMIKVDKQIFVYKKIKDNILTNSIGIIQDAHLSIATKERAFLDTLYNNTDYYFDNLRSLNWDMIFSILPIYQNMRLSKKVNQLYKLWS